MSAFFGFAAEPKYGVEPVSFTRRVRLEVLQ